ncbi:DUF222 domain-containing protein [Acrocarpospora sp. B8E8]|uniref:HNH endonuclease signature motif containing protein n=1 Tax=Acrocarpospora sp. B8E8 TaxID=3153572 RepID=UPI00325DB9BE
MPITVLIEQIVSAAQALAAAEIPDDADICVAQAKELLAARDRVTAAIAARVSQVHATGRVKTHGHASTRMWLRSAGGMAAPAASRLLELATQLDRLDVVRERFTVGTMTEGTASTICAAVADLTDEQARLAEPILVELADQATPAEVARAGRYLREILNPGTVDRETRELDTDRFLLVSESAGGGLQGRFLLPREAGARLRAWLDAYARPRAEGDDRPLRVRNADALDALLTCKVTTELLVLVRAESLPDDPPASTPTSTPAATPKSAPSPSNRPDDPSPTSSTTDTETTDTAQTDPTRTGTTGQDPRGQDPRRSDPAELGAARMRAAGLAGAGLGAPGRMLPGLLLATGHLLPVGDIHRLARTSKMVRMVLSAEGQVLDVGRAVRLATPAQRRALFSTYATCIAQGCPIPARLCQIDHIDPWVVGGQTNLDRLAPCCGFHNRDRAIHPERYELRKVGPNQWALTYLGVQPRPMRR